jgi:very-short-patch-repair endonuclease
MLAPSFITTCMDATTPDPTTTEALTQELERMRARLLDLSAKNSLLNYRHPRASSLRIVDEVPALVLQRMVGEGGFRFAPLRSEEAPEPVRERRTWGKRALPDPSLFSSDGATDRDDPALMSQSDRERREAAKAARARREEQIIALAQSLGINPSYDLQAAGSSEEEQHNDRKLQTLLTPDELEARLQKMQAAAVTAIQESGANMLHLLLGFVEWMDIEGGKARLAPLVLLPVTLARLELDASTHTFPYTVTASGEDWSTNVTLQEKCKKEFGFFLPSIEPEENLETYFARIEEILITASLRGWRVRRQLTLGLVSFGKILMWRDLDPAMWPKDQPLFGISLLREVLGSGEVDKGDEDVLAELRTAEYNIDRLPPECGRVPPIVVPADSSQHSVLVDVQRGHSLVVQGPPGTGKSQTITNIIADAIAARKKILFVAEKKAALDVVARRLAQAGLGPFCLPLHSHTSNKREFLDGLQERIALSGLGNSLPEMQTVNDLLTETRETLTGHTERLHAPFGSLGDTAFSILWRARRLGTEMPETVITALRGVTLANAVGVTPGELARQRAILTAFAASHIAVAADIQVGESHPWHGVTRADLSFDDVEALLALGRTAAAAMVAADDARMALEASMDGAAWPRSSEALSPLLDRCACLVPPVAGVPGTLIEAIHRRAGVESVHAALAASDLARRAWAEIAGPWGVPGAMTSGDHAAAMDALETAGLAFGATRTMADLAAAVRLSDRALEQLTFVETLSQALAIEVGVSAPVPVLLSLRLIEVALAAEQLPDGALILRAPALATPNAADRIATLASRAALIIRTSETLDSRFAPAMRVSVTELQETMAALSESTKIFPMLFSGRYRTAVGTYRRMSGGRHADRATMTSDVDAMLRHVTALAGFLADPAVPQLFGAAADGVHSPFAAATALLAWIKQATMAFRGTGEMGRTLAETVWSASAAEWSEAGARAGGAPTSIESATALRASLTDIATLTASNLAAWDALSISALRERLATWRLAAAHAGAVGMSAGSSPDATVVTLQDALGRVTRARAADDALAAHTDTFHELGLDLPPSVTAAETDALSSVRGALAYLAQFHQPGIPDTIVAWLAAGDPAGRLAMLSQGAQDLRTALSSATTAEANFTEAGGVDLRAWYGDWPEGATLTLRTQRFDRALLAGGTLARYVSRLRARAAVTRSPIPVAAELLESGGIIPKQLPSVYDYLLARTLAELVLRERPELDQFSGALHETRRAQFAALDETFIGLTQRLIAERANAAPRIRGVSYGPVKDLTEQSLIEREIEKTRRHVPIREMFRRSGRAIQALKPCIMMGPQAVAQYLPPGLFHFDLIVMDEASQMRPEDALGAIARGTQLVVVGDPKQLGPTSFFSTSDDEEEEIEEAAAVLAAHAAGTEEMPRGASVLERSESILLAATRRYPMRMLRWHYRSRYPQLISFSNQEFYGGDLVLFPHPGTEREDDGINFRAVESALYSSSINRREAEVVVEAVRRHAAEHPERTLLVVTMNQPQRELVDTMIQAAEKDDPTLAAFRARHEDTLEPFGVKNLENVQGDERDAIYVSVTYGPNDRGIVAQNFGPVNAVGGERRLNVLFTRAKFRLDVFCSFDPTSLRVTEASPRGLCVLRDYLRYAKEGTLAGGRFTGREPDSDFEVEVARALRAHGYDVHPQVGVAGYFLDMAVVDPQHPGRYVLAVECDGATYHSAKSARDRDWLRQGVLEGLGWNVHRIWSTDWFRDPRGETDKIVRRLQGLL